MDGSGDPPDEKNPSRAGVVVVVLLVVGACVYWAMTRSSVERLRRQAKNLAAQLESL